VITVGAPALGPGAGAELLEQVDQVLAPVQAHALVADEVAERGDALDVVADVGRRLRRGRMAVVHDRERAPPAGRRRRGRRVGRGRDPGPEPVAMRRGRRPRRGVVAHVAVERRERAAGGPLGAEAPDGGDDLIPAAHPDAVRVLGDERLDLAQRVVGREGQPGADVRGGREPRPGFT
jgi:hypothetical protein